MAEQKIGEVVKFFAKPSVAAIKILEGELRVGDHIKIKGHTTDFEDKVISIEIDNKPIEKATPGQLVGIKVKDRVREKDIVWKVIE